MDPWVHTQIRLAERKGLLVGYGLNPAQVKAVFLCEMLELAQASKKSERELREALLATGKFEFTDLFPEYSPAEESEQDIDADLSSEEGITYIFPKPGEPGGISPQEAERVLLDLVQDAASGSVSAAELDREDGTPSPDWGGQSVRLDWGEKP